MWEQQPGEAVEMFERVVQINLTVALIQCHGARSFAKP